MAKHLSTYRDIETQMQVYSTPNIRGVRNKHHHKFEKERGSMSISYSSPEDFMNFLRYVHENSMSLIQLSSPNQDFQKALEEKISNMKLDINITIKSAYDYIVNELWKSLRSVIPPHVLTDLDKIIAVGALDNMFVNALSAKSPEGYIAICINAGLMALLNKLSKIQAASAYPNSIIFCSRADPKEITSEMLKRWYLEICDHYHRTGKPLGPRMLLSGTAEIQHSMQLHFWEMYVLCHEMGHFLCGHLAVDKFLHRNQFLGMVDSLEENKHHEMETDADLLGYLLLREYFHKGSIRLTPQTTGTMDDRDLLRTLIQLFDLLDMLGASETKSHPDPIDRLCNVALFVYGEAVAETLAKSYEHHDLLVEIFKEPLVVRSQLEAVLAEHPTFIWRAK